MSVSVHNLQSGLETPILEGIAAAHDLSIFVRYRDRWLRGCRAGPPKLAAELAETVFQRSGLPVQVRNHDGQRLIKIDESGIRYCDTACSQTDGSHTADSLNDECDPGQKFVCIQ